MNHIEDAASERAFHVGLRNVAYPNWEIAETTSDQLAHLLAVDCRRYLAVFAEQPCLVRDRAYRVVVDDCFHLVRVPGSVAPVVANLDDLVPVAGQRAAVLAGDRLVETFLSVVPVQLAVVELLLVVLVAVPPADVAVLADAP